jgi:hypothetical protein
MRLFPAWPQLVTAMLPLPSRMQPESLAPDVARPKSATPVPAMPLPPLLKPELLQAGRRRGSSSGSSANAAHQYKLFVRQFTTWLRCSCCMEYHALPQCTTSSSNFAIAAPQRCSVAIRHR